MPLPDVVPGQPSDTRVGQGRRTRLSLLVLAGLAVLASSVPASAQKPRAERPTYALGDQWVRSDGVFELIRADKSLYVFAAGPRRQVHLTRDLGFARLESNEYWLEIDPPIPLRWPLEVGKWGVVDVLWRWQAKPGGIPARLTWTVEAFEEISVTAGRFGAFRIQIDVEYSRATTHRHRLWYAPEARHFIKAEWMLGALAARFEVVSVERPETPPLSVVLAQPADGSTVASAETVLVGKVSGGKGVARVSITLNGAEVSTQEEKRAPRKEVALSLPIKLREGKNIVLVTAADPEGNTRQAARTLFFDRPTPPALPPPPSPPTAVAALPPLQVTLSSPRDQARADQDRIALAGLVSGGKGISRVAVSLNGVEVSRLEERTPQPALAVNLPVTLREGQNTLVVTATDAGGMIQQEVRTIHYEKPVPLTVAFRYPEDRSRVSEEASVVAAVVTSSKGVQKLSVTLNGVEVHQQSERVPQKSMLVTVPVTLREGANAIAVSASEPDGTLRQEVRTVIYDRPQVAVAAPVAPAPPAPIVRDRWAVVIGVGRYESPDIPKLRYTVPDAEAFYQVLTGPAGFKKEHVLLLTDKTEKKPTLRNIKWALGTYLARSANKDDTVLIFFAGHGAPEVDQRGIERDGLSKYLVPSDAEPDDLYSTALPMDEVQTIFGRIEAERVVVFLDSCYSGAAGGRTFASKKTRAMNVDDLFLERLTRSKGRAIITASRPAEVSIELPELGHGIFTYYLVQGLKGSADLNRDGIVSIQELYEYVEQQVAQKSRAVGGNQHPVMKGELEGVLPLVKLKGP